jgi:hypothetical protein
MVISFANINKMNYHLSYKLNSLKTKKTRAYDVGNPGTDLGQVQKCGGVKSINGIPTLPP